MVKIGDAKIHPKRDILHPFLRPTSGFLLFSAKQFMKSNLPPLGKKWKVGIFELAHGLDWFVLFDMQIFSGGVYPPSATSRAISSSISNSFWY